MRRSILLYTAIFIFGVIISCKKYYTTTDTQILQALTDTFSIKAYSTSWKWDSGGILFIEIV